VIAADEDIDIAILTFANDAKPFATGLDFVTTPADEGADVFAAGFPGLGTEQIWQFSRGIISNAAVRFPRDPVEDADISEARFGPFIQHTSPIDPGNSGGPLLVALADAKSGYAVAGINAMIARRRASTFYAIPADRALAYISAAIKPKDDEAKRRSLDLRLDAFVKSIAKPKAVYAAIAAYISNACTASNAEYAIMETFSRAPRTVQEHIDTVSDPVEWMQYSVAWLIEDSFRGKTTGVLRAELGDIKKNIDGSYTVPLKFSGDREIVTTWVDEFGIWKLEKAGDLVSGDKSLVEKKEMQQKSAQRKKGYDNFIMPSLAYAQLFDHKIGEKRVYSDPWDHEYTTEPLTEPAPGLDISVLIAHNKYILYGLSLVLAEDFWQLDGTAGFSIPIDLKAVVLAPNAGLGILFRNYGEGVKIPQTGLVLKGGIMATLTAVPGLYLLAAYQYNIPTDVIFEDKKVADQHILKFGIGYAFRL
jgi:serine protease Do